MPTPLYPFQVDAVERASSDFKKMRAEKAQTGNSSALLISMPCGMGKTVVLAAFIREMLSQSITLVLTPGKGNLAAQTHSVLQRELSDTTQDVILIGENNPPPSNPRPGTVIVTNYEKVVVKDRNSGEYKSRISREGEVTNFWDMVNHVKSSGMELVVAIDEAHYGSHGSRGRIGEFFNDINARYGAIPLRVETTATPNAKTRTVDVYTVEAKPWEGVKAGLLRNRIVLNLGRDTLEETIRDEFRKNGNPDWSNSADMVMAELMYRQWKSVKTMINSGAPQDAYNPLMLFCISNAHQGEEELANIERFLASKGITRGNGTLAVHLTDDSLSFDAQRALTNPNSPVSALVFKQSIALGWDCPRAQFMLLTRKVSETASTFTEQLLGRIRRQVYGRKRGVDALDTAYLYSMCDPLVVAQQSGIPADTSETVEVANSEQWDMWKAAGLRKTITVRKGRAGGISQDGTKVSDPLTRADIIEILQGITPKGTLSGDAESFSIAVTGEQNVEAGKTLIANLRLKDSYRSLLKEKVLHAVREAMSASGVKGKGRLTEVSYEPFLMWLEQVDGVTSSNAQVMFLTDLEASPYGGLVHSAMQDMCNAISAKEGSIVRNHYEESDWIPYIPPQMRYRPTEDAALDANITLHTYTGDLARTNLYGAVTKDTNTASEKLFENEFLTRLIKSGVLLSWIRNDPTLDSYGTSFSLAYRKPGGNTASSQMFPDYILLVSGKDGTILPVAVEVKGSDNGRPVDASSDGSLDAKAKRLAELTSQDDAAFGSREDTLDDEGTVTHHGRGYTIGALVFRDKGQWRVYGQGAQEEFSVWLKSHGVDL